MPTYEHVREGRRINVSGAEVEAAYAADQNWCEVRELTPKQQLQADARGLGLDDSGTVPEIEARIAEHKANLPLTDEELAAARERGLPVDDKDSPASPAWVRAELAKPPEPAK